MLLSLSKVLDVAVSPLAWALMLLAGALLSRRRPRMSSTLAAGALAILYGCSIEPVANAIMRRVEAGCVRGGNPARRHEQRALARAAQPRTANPLPW